MVAAPLLVALTALLGVLSGPTGSVALAHDPGSPRLQPRQAAWPGEGGLSVSITSFTPDIPRASSRMRIRGTLTNVSQIPLRDVRAVLRISPTRLVGRAEIEQVLSGDTTREGLPVPGTETALADELAAGASTGFDLRADVEQLGLGAPGAYVTAVEALADSGDGLARQALARTFLPWWPAGTDAEPIGLTLLWPITGEPARDALGVFLDEKLAVAMSATGRLDAMVQAGRRYPRAATWLIDPHVTQAASVMSRGYQVYADPGTGLTEPGTRTKEAAEWLANVKQAVSNARSRAVTTLYAVPDLDPAQDSRALGNLLSQRSAVEAETAALLGKDLGSGVAVAPEGNLTEVTLATLARRRVPLAVLAESAMPLVRPTNHTPTGAAVISTAEGDLPVLLRDQGLDSTLAMPSLSNSDLVAMRQRLLAETISAALELPATPRILVTTPPMSWIPTNRVARAVLEVADDTPWIKTRSISQALRGGRTGPSRTHLELTAEQVDSQLPAEYVKSVRANQRGVTTYRGMVSDPATVGQAFVQAPSRQLSAWFRSDVQSRDTLQALVTTQVSRAVESVSVISSGSVTISGASGMIPVTVANDGTSAVTVGLTLTSPNPALFQAQPVEPFRIEPGRRRSREVRAEVIGSRSIPVNIQLVTAEGAAIGEPRILIVRSTAYARAARMIVQLALAMLVLAVLVHGVRRIRRTRRADPGGTR